MPKYEYDPLTPRQKEVVRLLSLGCTVEETAAVLKLSPATVDNHKTRAMYNLGCDNRALLTRIAMRLKITKMNETLTLAEKRRSGRKNDGWN